MEISRVMLYAIVPVIVVMGAGFMAGRRRMFDAADAARFNKVVLDFALPAALFVSIVQASRSALVQDLKLMMVATAAIMGCFMAVYFVFRYCFKGNDGADGAVSALISGSPSIGFLGFAVLEPIFGATPEVALVVAIVGIVVNAIGIPVGLSLLALARRSHGGAPQQRGSAWRPVAEALSKPVAWAPMLAVLWVMAGIPWPAWLSPSFALMAKANASLAVFSAGITLSAIKIRMDSQAVWGCLMKMILMPAVALALGILCRMDPSGIKMLVVASALPPAFSGIIIADEYQTFVAPGTTSLALSVILFAPLCPLWLYLTDHLTI